ncbi:MAG TPA: DUF2795 domain-containing protein [Pseudonocardiaceae bacterium]|nr:DUF2795 domain-containing protein [Pseudonocardiaceae bacterium]
MNKPNPVQMQKFLGGVNYPASRDDLVEHARSAGADDEVLEHLRSLPDRTFDGPSGVSQAYSRDT